MRREPRLTKRERKAIHGKGPLPPAPGSGDAAYQSNPIGARSARDPGAHLHCVACGKHLDTVGEADKRAARGLQSNLWMAVRCAHGSEWVSCMGCLEKSKELLDEHDRTGEAVRSAAAWH
jgi:hypothetical protein